MIKPAIILFILLQVAGGRGLLEDAVRLFRAHDYRSSLAAYRLVLNRYPAQGPEIRYNMAQCYLAMDSTEAALSLYHLVDGKRAPVVASRAQNNIGTLLAEAGKSPDALRAFRTALLLNPENDTARYNLELLSKRLAAAAEKDVEEEPDDLPDAFLAATPEEDGDEMDPSQRLLALYEKMGWSPPVPSENAPSQTISDTIPIRLAEQILKKLDEREILFLQELRKRAIEDQEKGARPRW